MIIAFSGLDGSGKSTHCDELIQWLRTQGYNAVQIHITSWTLTNRLGRLLQRIRGETTAGWERTGISSSLAELWGRAILGLVDVGLFHLYAFCQTRIRHRILVCDRYFYDLLVNLQYLGFRSSVYAGLYRLLIKRPDVSFMLKPDPSLSYARKPEQSIQYFSIKASLYQRLLSMPGRVTLGGEDLSADRRLIHAQISELMAKRGHKVRL